MKQVEHDLLTNKYTKVVHEENITFNAPHHFQVYQVYPGMADDNDPRILQEVIFQKGPVKEYGVNGVANEDLIAMVICRLEHFQKSEFSSRENSIAITKLEEALLWLRKRTIQREKRGVEGTSKK